MLQDAALAPGIGPLLPGGLLMAGPGRLLTLDDPPSVLLAQISPAAVLEEWLRRVRLDGAPLWQAGLPTAGEVAQVLVEPGRLWLLARPHDPGGKAARHPPG